MQTSRKACIAYICSSSLQTSRKALAWQNKRSAVSLVKQAYRSFFSNPKSNTIDAENGLPRLDFVKSRNDDWNMDCHENPCRFARNDGGVDCLALWLKPLPRNDGKDTHPQTPSAKGGLFISCHSEVSQEAEVSQVEYDIDI